MKHYASTKARCPYYREESRSAVHCVSWCDEAALRLSFASPTECVRYKNEYCKGNYETCRIAKMLDAVFADKVWE